MLPKNRNPKPSAKFMKPEGEEILDVFCFGVLYYPGVNHSFSREYEVLNLTLREVQVHIKLGKVGVQELVDHLDIRFLHLSQTLDGSFSGGRVVVYGLADRYTDYVYNEKNASLVGAKNHDQLESIRKKIIAGEVVVDDTAVGQ